MSHYALSISPELVVIHPDQAASFAELNAAAQQEVEAGWRAQQHQVFPQDVLDSWVNMSVNDCMSKHDAMGLACGIAVARLSSVNPTGRFAMMPMKREEGGAYDDWVPCGRNCHGGQVLVSSSGERGEAGEFAYEHDGWKGLQTIKVDMSLLQTRDL